MDAGVIASGRLAQPNKAVIAINNEAYFNITHPHAHALAR